MIIPPNFLAELREALPLKAVASKYVVWDSRKSNHDKGDLWAPCPFHNEKSASFHVDDRKGFYYCFGCHAKGDQITLVRELENINFEKAVRQLAFIAGIDGKLRNYQMAEVFPTLIELKDFMVENFDQENYLEVGILTGWTSQIQNHQRLLRSLSWGDPDYPGCVLDLLSSMSERDPDAITKIKTYVTKKFATATNAISEVSSFSASQKVLGYNYEAPRNDIIGVMMPFHGSFSNVYDAIKNACQVTPLPPKRADEVWNHSAIISDILELLNHSAVVICDLTGRNENVFYELGIAHAWGKPVIPIAQSMADVPFDLQHHRCLTYLNNSEGLTELSGKLSERLVTLLGRR